MIVKARGGYEVIELSNDEGRFGVVEQVTVHDRRGIEWIVKVANIPNGPLRGWSPHSTSSFSPRHVAECEPSSWHYLSPESAMADAFGMPILEALRLYNDLLGLNFPEGYSAPTVGEYHHKADTNLGRAERELRLQINLKPEVRAEMHIPDPFKRSKMSQKSPGIISLIQSIFRK